MDVEKLICQGGWTTRDKTRPVMVGNVKIGGGAPVRVQSMCLTKTEDIDETVAQIHRLEQAGCEIVRVAVPYKKAAQALPHILDQINIPLVADIHFDYKMALMAIEAGVHKCRLNPGNIRDVNKVEAVVKAAQERGIPIRIGVNAGSLDPELLMKYGGPTPEALVESAAKEIGLLERLNFYDIVVSLKSSHVMECIQAYLLFASKFQYPTHVGVTEAGLPFEGTIASAVGIGAILAHGIGDTIRVSLTTDPEEEVKVGFEILRALGLRKQGVHITACPGCGRLEVDLVWLAEEVKKRTAHIKEPLEIAVMGCLPAGEKVIGEEGLSAINALREGQKVLTHTGQLKPITAVMKHLFHGDLLEIKPRGAPPLRLTPGHPVLVMERNGKVKGGRRRWENITNVVGNGQKPHWVLSEEVRRDHVVLYPILQGENEMTNVPDFSPPIPLDDDFLAFAACYVAEGSVGGTYERPNQIFLTFRRSERAIAERVQDIAHRYGLTASLRERVKKKTVEVVISSSEFAEAFVRLFGRRAENKKLPSWMLTLSKSKQAVLLKNLWVCDGYVGKVKGYWRATYVTASKTLAYQVHQLLLRQGVAAHLTVRRQTSRQQAYAITVSSQDALQKLAKVLGRDIPVENADPKNCRIAIDDRYLYLPVAKVEKSHYHGFVHNLEVRGDETFVGSFTVHNCVVNGPGESRRADAGIAAGRGKAALYVKGETVRTIEEGDIVGALVSLAEELAEKRKQERDGQE